MLSKHDEMLLSDLRFQPLWLLAAYVVVGVLAAGAGLALDGLSAKVLCIGGGFLIALGAEKAVSRRIRKAALALVADRRGVGG